MKDTEIEEGDEEGGKEESGGEQVDWEEEAEPMKEVKVVPKSKGWKGPKSKVEVEDQVEEKPAPARKVGPKSEVEQESKVPEEKPKKGWKVVSKPKVKEEEDRRARGKEEQKVVSIKNGCKVGPESKTLSEPDYPFSQQGQRPKVKGESEGEEKGEEEDDMLPAKRCKVEEGQKTGRRLANRCSAPV